MFNTEANDVFCPENSISVDTFGACGIPDKGIDSTDAIQAALDKGGVIYVPRGEYTVSSTLFVGSDTSIVLHPNAKITLAPESMKRRGDFFITNKDHANGNENIRIRGGYFDGNGLKNPKGAIFDTCGFSGVMFNFRNVRNLSVTDTVMMNPSGYYNRLCRVSDFEFKNITFISFAALPTNDGVHIGGYCENGTVSKLNALTPYTPSDDMVALNADDCITRVENLDMECGYIRNISISELTAPDCHTFIRLLSVDSEISHIKATGIRGGCSMMAINLDGARYCRTPIIPDTDERFFGGAGNISDIEISDIDITSTRSHDGALIRMETDVKNFTVSRFMRPCIKDEKPLVPTLIMTNTSASKVTISGLSPECAESLATDSSLSEKIDADHRGCTLDIGKGDRLVISRGGFEKLIINKSE